MYNNKNYKRDISYTYELNRFFLRILGVWPYANKKFCLLQKLRKSVLIFGCYFILCCDLISILLYIFVVQKETHARIKIIGVVLFTIVSIFKYSNMLYVENQMKDCLACVEKDFQSVTSSTARNTMLFHARTGRRLLILCGIFMYGGGMTYRTAIPLSREKIVTAQNITIRPLPCPAYYVVFDSQISPTYEIVFFVQCLTGFLKYTITVAGCGIAALFTMHIVAQLDILMVLMNNLTVKHELEHVNKKLSVIVQHQIKIRNFLDMVQGVVHFSSFVELMACTSIICLMIYCLIMEWEASNAVAICTYCILVISFIFNIFVYCFIGEQLSEKGEEVALTACTLDWHLLPDANARALILIMLMCNKTMKLRAGNFLELSFRTFGSVVKTAVGYLNLLRSVVD
ncbi:odorant receptor 82a-like [Odontomachus brunneus]|uniref:odorant receptor 82a-like n=1 Tax=Odontomachus brunneus TaxID=486640 RepID=UPI0013F2579A|nr:odorant receptor 82a-like [Odontomachus brunneus]